MMVVEENLGDGLVLHTVRNAEDAARYCALNEAVVREGDIGERLLHCHPGTTYDDYVLVEDTETGEAVSTTCLLPWRITYEGSALETAMLEMVVTHPDYRRRGLIRTQIAYFHRAAAARNFDLCIIQGIPHYYRQYGYAYALDHTPCEQLPVWRIPDDPAEPTSPYNLRQATPEDAPVLTALYEAEMRTHALSVQRTADYWRYLLQATPYPVRIVEDSRAGHAVGYILMMRSSERRVWVSESALPGYEAGMAVLRQLKAEVPAEGPAVRPGEIQIGGSSKTTLVRIARSLGSQRPPPYQWLLRIPDIARLLTRIGPVLEARLARAGCADLTTDLSLNLYREAFVLHFERGSLRSVEPVGFMDASLGADGGDLAIPTGAFVRLLFGYRNLDALHDAWPDITVKTEHRYLWETLFPQMDSLIVMPY